MSSRPEEQSKRAKKRMLIIGLVVGTLVGAIVSAVSSFWLWLPAGILFGAACGVMMAPSAPPDAGDHPRR